LHEVQNEQVGRVEDVEDVLRPSALDEPTLTVVHVDRDKREPAHPSAAEDSATDYSLHKPVLPQRVQEQDERVAVASVVGMQHHRNDQQPDKRDGKAEFVFCIILQRTQAQIAQQKREKHVLRRMMPCAGVNQIPRHFGDKRENQQVQAVLLPVVRMQKTLYNQESEDREPNPPDAAANEIPRDAVMAEREHRLDKRGKGAQVKPCRMVDNHQRHGEKFQSAPA